VIETLALGLFLAVMPLEESTAMGVTILKLAGGLAFAAWLLSRLRSRDPLRWDPGLTLMALFVVWGAASYFWSIDHAVSMDLLPTYTLLLVSYFLVINVIRNEGQLSPAMIGLWLGMLVLVTSGVLGLSAVRTDVEDSRLAGVVGNANGYVALLVACVPAGYWVFARTRVPFRKVVTAVVLLAAGITSFYTKSRGGFISIGVLFLTLLAFRQTRRRAFGFVILFLVLTFRLAPLGLWQRIDHARRHGDLRTTELWPAGLAALGHRPLLGFGLGTNGLAISRWGATESVHNSPLAVAIELGVLGLVLYSSLLVYCTVRLWRAIASATRQGRTKEAGFGVVLLASFFGYMTTWFKGGGMEAAKMLWVLLGLMSAYARILDQSAHLSSEPVQRTDLRQHAPEDKVPRSVPTAYE
jgi:O-antigen ligase